MTVINGIGIKSSNAIHDIFFRNRKFYRKRKKPANSCSSSPRKIAWWINLNQPLNHVADQISLPRINQKNISFINNKINIYLKIFNYQN